VVSFPFARAAVCPEGIAGLDALGAHLLEVMKPSPAYQVYQAVAPRPEDFARLLDKIGALARQDYDWTADVARLPPTLLIGADADYFPLSHLLEVYARLGGGARDPGWDGSGGRSSSQLAIIPGTSHYDILESPLVVAVVEAWLARS
jgi:pimeloyl-ACP methyl ester carboxylesterase